MTTKVHLPAFLVALIAVVGVVTESMKLTSLFTVNVPVTLPGQNRVDQLMKLEHRRYLQDREEPTPKGTTFEELLNAQNPNLGESIERMSRTPGPQVLVVHGPAGWGKSLLLSQAILEKASSRPRFQLDLRRDIAVFSKERDYAPDLSLGSAPVNSLPVLPAVTLENLFTALTRDSLEWERVNPRYPQSERVLRLEANEARAALIVFDSVDELAQESVIAFMERLKRFSGDSPASERDFVLLARTEVVDAAVRRSSRESLLSGIDLVALRPHDLRRSEIGIRVKNLIEYYQSLAKSGNSTIHLGVDMATVDQAAVTGAVTSYIDRFPELSQLFRNSALGKLVVDSCLEMKDRKLGNSLLEIRTSVLTRVLERNFGSHGRPREQDGRYIAALRAIAESVDPDSKGFFTVPTGLEGTLPDGSRFNFSPYNVLQRSGMVSFHPGKGNGAMRFEPVWLQQAIAEGHPSIRRTISWWRVGIGGLVLILIHSLSRRMGTKLADEHASEASTPAV